MYVWDNVLADYAYGLVVVVAKSTKDALRIALEKAKKHEGSFCSFLHEITGINNYVIDIPKTEKYPWGRDWAYPALKLTPEEIYRKMKKKYRPMIHDLPNGVSIHGGS
jgi:hypothetical protein